VATIVLVHMANAGGWIFRSVAACLRAAGHLVYTPTLTGLGERVHLAHPDIDLETHIQDIVNVLTFEDLHDVSLLGHSYGGTVITGVAERIPERLTELIYLDSTAPRDGESSVDTLGEAVKEIWGRSSALSGDGWRLPAGKGDPRLVPHPCATLTQPARIGNPLAQDLKRTFISCTAKPDDWPLKEPIDQFAAQARAAGWRYRELNAGHSAALFRAPDRLATLLLELFPGD